MPPGIGYGRDIPIASEGAPGTPQAGGKGRGVSPQEAVKILSLRVPERPSPNAIAPLPLLMSQGGNAAGAQGLDQLIEGLIGVFQPPGPAGVPQMPPVIPQPSAPSAPVQITGRTPGRTDPPSLPTFSPSPQQQAPQERREVAPPPPPQNIPPPRITPGEDVTDAPKTEVNDPFTPPPLPMPNPGDFKEAPQNPWLNPGRNARLAEKYGFDLDAGMPLF